MRLEDGSALFHLPGEALMSVTREGRKVICQTLEPEDGELPVPQVVGPGSAGLPALVEREGQVRVGLLRGHVVVGVLVLPLLLSVMVLMEMRVQESTPAALKVRTQIEAVPRPAKATAKC